MKLWFRRGVWLSKHGRRVLESFNPSDIRRVAVIRHAALGDMILTRNFLIELRRFSPDVFITFSVVSQYTSGVPHDLVNRVHVLGPWKLSLDYWGNMRELGTQDIIFDLAATNRSLWLCQLNTATLKIGFPYRPIHRFFYDIVVPRSDLTFEVEDMLNMLRIFGHIPGNPRAYDLPGTPVKSTTPYVLYFTTASTTTKCWPRERFVALIHKMADAFPSNEHHVLSGKEEWESTEEMKTGLQNRTNVSFINADTVDEVISVVKGATMVISNDTSVRNIAIAAGVPSLGLFLSTALFRYLPMNGHHRIVYNRDGGIPTVDEAFKLAVSVLQELETIR